MRVLIIGNCLAEQQQSMIRFARLLVRFYEPHAVVRLVWVPLIVARLPGMPAIARKYLAYIDKLILFPFWLIMHAGSYQLVHISDHGNAYYSFCCSPNRCIVTCHDLLAVRGAIGDSSVACKPSPIGIWLQKLIIAGLKRAGALVFVSKSTFNDFLRIVPGWPPDQRHAVIPNTLNASFTANPAFELSLDEQLQLPFLPYLLMVGSSHPRKNRLTAIRLLLELGATSNYQLVLAGDPLNELEKLAISDYQLTTRVISIVGPSHLLLNHLYCHAHALLFPSLAEGFGWPLIEAQACGCPVVASNTTSIPEVAGQGALFADPHDVVTFASHVRSLEDPTLRAALITCAANNLNRFSEKAIAKAYVDFSLSSTNLSA